MSRDRELFDKIAELEEAETPYALATVYMVRGSSSGKMGDKAVYDHNGRRIIGYIGGGCIENRVAETAREAILDGVPRTVDIDLDSDLMGMGIPCGGYMSVIVEPQVRVPTLLVRGMGRVVEVLCQMARTLKFKVVVQTPEGEASRYPEASEVLTKPLEIDDIDFPVDYFVLATHHRDDDRIAWEALKRGISYVAVVASKKKTGIITDYFRAHGIADADLERFHAPAGLDLKARTAEEIALSILSEIVMHRNGGTGQPMRAASPDAAAEERAETGD